MNRLHQIRKIIRLIWIIGGLGIMAWIILSYQSRGIDPSVLASNGEVAIEYSSPLDRFAPLSTPKSTALIFYPGAMVDSKAYIPLLKQIAANGYPVYLIHLPYRLAPFPAQVEELFQTTLATIEQETSEQDSNTFMGHRRSFERRRIGCTIHPCPSAIGCRTCPHRHHTSKRRSVRSIRFYKANDQNLCHPRWACHTGRNSAI